jgi:type IV fimbrial biogenesis protein FimT
MHLVRMSMRQSRGFTLFELMVVVAVIAILSAIAAPSFTTFIATQRLRNASFDLVSDLLLARSAALNQQADVVITPSTISGGEWSNGWTITSPSGTLTSRTGIASTVRFVPVDSSSASVAALTFGSANGGRLTTAATPVKITVKSTDLPSAKWSCVMLDATGRAKAASLTSPGPCP